LFNVFEIASRTTPDTCRPGQADAVSDLHVHHYSLIKTWLMSSVLEKRDTGGFRRACSFDTAMC